MNKKDIDPANIQINPMEEKGVGAVAVIGSMYVGTAQREYYWEKLGSATKGAGIGASLVADARMTGLKPSVRGKKDEVRRNRV